MTLKLLVFEHKLKYRLKNYFLNNTIRIQTTQYIHCYYTQTAFPDFLAKLVNQEPIEISTTSANSNYLYEYTNFYILIMCLLSTGEQRNIKYDTTMTECVIPLKTTHMIFLQFLPQHQSCYSNKWHAPINDSSDILYVSFINRC